VPALYDELEDALAGDAGIHIEPFLRVASWIGGDRDGNPHVTHEVTARAAERQAGVAFAHYLREIHALGSELSLAVAVHGGSSRARRRSSRGSPTRREPRAEPFRRALVASTRASLATARPSGRRRIRGAADGGGRAAPIPRPTSCWPISTSSRSARGRGPARAPTVGCGACAAPVESSAFTSRR